MYTYITVNFQASPCNNTNRTNNPTTPYFRGSGRQNHRTKYTFFITFYLLTLTCIHHIHEAWYLGFLLNHITATYVTRSFHATILKNHTYNNTVTALHISNVWVKILRRHRKLNFSSFYTFVMEHRIYTFHLLALFFPSSFVTFEMFLRRWSFLIQKEKFINVLKRKRVRTVKPYSFCRIINTMKKNKEPST